MKNRNAMIYTIGYANKTIDEFVSCLKKYNIKYLLDVRSEPYSKRFPIFNKESIDYVLRNHGFKYAWFGEYFGARRIENVYSNVYSIKGEYRKQVSFKKVYKTKLFKEGVKRIQTALDKDLKICFMCSETEPSCCHRFWMVAFYFKEISCDVKDVINIINHEHYKTFDSVIDEVNLNQEMKLFYKEHNYEIEGYSLVEKNRQPWIEWWLEFFRKKDTNSKKQDFSNYLIGYVKEKERYE